MTTQQKIDECYNKVFEKGFLSTDKTVKECFNELATFKQEKIERLCNFIRPYINEDVERKVRNILEE